MKLSLSSRLAFCGAVLLAAAACSTFGASHGVSTYDTTAKKKKPGPFHYLAVRATKEGAGITDRPDRELFKPFRTEATLGLFDPDHADLGPDGEFGVSILQSGGLGAFYILTVKRSGDGIVLEVGTGGAPINTLTLADSLVAEVVFETNGGIILVSGRKPGDADYTPIAALSAPAAGPYQLSFDVSNLRKGAVVGMSRSRVVSNGAPASPTAVQTQRETAYTAADALAEAMYALDGLAPDRTAAGNQLDAAVTRFDAALALEPPSAVRKKLTSARKKARTLATKARGKTAPLALIKAITNLIHLTGTATARLE